VGGQRHASAALSPEKTRYPLYRGLGGTQGRSGQVRKISPQPGFDTRTVQPVASRYTDCAIAAPEINRYKNKLTFLAILKCLFLIWTQEASCYSCERIELRLYLYGLTYTVDIQFIHFPLERPFIECCVGKLIGIYCENQTRVIISLCQ
jgi:hypothetical protein